jgi:hypothetical protein
MVMRQALSLGWMTMVLWGVAACGSSSTDTTGSGGSGGDGGAGGGTDTSAAALAACTVHSEAFCKKQLECYPHRAPLTGSLTVCTERVTSRCLSRLPLPGTSVTPDGLSACAAEIAAPGCDMFTTTPAACIFVGTLPDGELCAESAQCASGYCDTFYSDGCGRCAAGGEPDPICPDCPQGKMACYYSGEPCGFGYVCPGDACIPAPAEGEGCGYDYAPCNYPSTCQGDVCRLEYPICEE